MPMSAMLVSGTTWTPSVTSYWPRPAPGDAMALPDAAELLAAYSFLARRYGWRGEASVVGVARVVAEARTLAVAPGDEAAAICFALSRHPRVFPGGWRVMTAVLLDNMALRHGSRVAVTPDELASLRLDIAAGAVDWATVRDFIGQRTRER